MSFNTNYETNDCNVSAKKNLVYNRKYIPFSLSNTFCINTFHSGVRDTRTCMPTLAYRCTSILILAIPCQQLPPGARAPACTVGCQRLPPANANSRLAEQDTRGCSKSQITNITFIIGIHSRSGQ